MLQVFTVLLCASTAFSTAVNLDYFRCHTDLCKRTEQYCVEEKQRCYHCADVAHLCNTTELSRDCDSYCYRVRLQNMMELEANRSEQLADTQIDLQQEQQRNNDLELTVSQLESNVSRLTKVKERLTVKVTETEKQKTEFKEVVKQLRQMNINFFIACTVGSVLMFTVILLAGALCCLYCREKRHSHSVRLSQSGECPGDSSSDHLPLLNRCTNLPTASPGLTINGDVRVSRLEVQSPDDKNIIRDMNSTLPPAYQSRLEEKKNSTEITVQDPCEKYDINKCETERTPSVLKNIQPTDSYESIKDTDPKNIQIIDSTDPK
ncbi:uncharacterized protein [Haliotis cracherodii]|uniref:uncharacterized protein n=1 Tax=Haliotis cracherodii TaxID=6455 RepID=UPI0039EA7C07